MNAKISHIAIASISLILVATTASAQHFDIFLARPANGTQTVIGGADVDSLNFDDTTRVFALELDQHGGEFFALEPGVNHPNVNHPGIGLYPASATALLPGDELSLFERDFEIGGVLDDLFYWNGVLPVSFVPASARFRVDGGAPLGGIAGFGGAFDEHPFFVVDDDSIPGVYIASVYGVVNGFAPSQSIYLVMGTESLITPDFLGVSQSEFDSLSDEELDEALEGVIYEAAEWVKSNLVPEPTSFALLSVAACVASVLRRQRFQT